MSFIRSYVVPEGFPESVTPSYVPYMTWRAMKVYFHYIIFRFHDLLNRCFYLILPFFFLLSAFLWWSNGCVYNKNLAQLCWSLPKQGCIWCCGYQLDTQGKILSFSFFIEKTDQQSFLFLIFVEVMFKENKACNIVSKIKNTMSLISIQLYLYYC